MGPQMLSDRMPAPSSTPTLRDVVDPETRGNLAKFARRVKVSWTTAWRWTLPPNHRERVVPPSDNWPAIEKATDGRWKAPKEFGAPARQRRRS